MDKYEIYIYKDVDWEIRTLGLEDYESIPPYDKTNSKYSFGIMKIFSNGKIAYVFDISCHDEDIEAAKDDKMMQEICDFAITTIDFMNKKTIEQKSMSIYEALLYIAKKREEIANEQ